MKRLTNLWNKFKALKWWQKALLLLPLVIACIFLIFLIVVPKSDGRKFDKVVEHHKKHVDDEIQKKQKLDKLLEKKERRLREAQRGIQKEIKRNEKEATNLINRIDSAANDNNDAELERIHAELSNAAKRRTNP